MYSPDDPNDYRWDDEPAREPERLPWHYSPVVPIVLAWGIVYALYRAVLVVWHSL